MMTVRELIDALESEDENALVYFVCDYGDHTHTQQALPVKEIEGGHSLVKSAYSRSGLALKESDDDEREGPDEDSETGDEGDRVVVLQ